MLVACREFRETENQSAVAYHKQIRHRYLVSTWKKLPCMSKQMAKINQSQWLIITLRSRRKHWKLANQQSCSISWPIRARISLLTRSSDTEGRKVNLWTSWGLHGVLGETKVSELIFLQEISVIFALQLVFKNRYISRVCSYCSRKTMSLVKTVHGAGDVLDRIIQLWFTIVAQLLALYFGNDLRL